MNSRVVSAFDYGRIINPNTSRAAAAAMAQFG